MLITPDRISIGIYRHFHFWVGNPHVLTHLFVGADIITDEVAAYFAGDKDVQTTANMIQSRVNLYVQEQR